MKETHTTNKYSQQLKTYTTNKYSQQLKTHQTLLTKGKQTFPRTSLCLRNGVVLSHDDISECKFNNENIYVMDSSFLNVTTDANIYSLYVTRINIRCMYTTNNNS